MGVSERPQGVVAQRRKGGLRKWQSVAVFPDELSVV